MSALLEAVSAALSASIERQAVIEGRTVEEMATLLLWRGLAHGHSLAESTRYVREAESALGLPWGKPLPERRSDG